MEIEEYFGRLNVGLERAYAVASEARKTGQDPETFVEIPITTDLASRVEGLVGPKGVASRIKELEGKKREEVMLAVARDIVEGRLGSLKTAEQRIEQALRTANAIITEGVVSASLEGISRVAVKTNQDGSRFLSVYFSGPIRSAGGTAQALTVVVADYVRKLSGIDNYRPTETEINRYIEEINACHNLVDRLQYKPTDEEIRIIVENCPVQIDGEPTSDKEVSVYKNVPGVETNRIRGGMALVIGEGIALKKAKVLKISQQYGLGWEWLEKLIKIKKADSREESQKDAYLADIVGGRPIFSYPGYKGGFRLRYGRCRTSGIAAKSIHPATMYILGGFPAIGTQFKVEKPGKGTAITPCETIEGPVVKLMDGSVVRVEGIDSAKKLAPMVSEILFLGDLLISYGDFSKSNHVLLPAGYCEEWWAQEAEKAGVSVDPHKVDAEQAVELSEKYKIPLHPRYTYFYHDITREELIALAAWLAKGELESIEKLDGGKPPSGGKPPAGGKAVRLSVDSGPEKAVLEKLCVPHKVVGSNIVIEDALPLLKTLGLMEGGAEKIAASSEENGLALVNITAPFPVRAKAPTYIGARMGRPEKAKERLMEPAPHGLFPVGDAGGKTRSIAKAAEKGTISVELLRLRCPACRTGILSYKCPSCGARAEAQRACGKCGRSSNEENCPCGGETIMFERRVVDLGEELARASKRLGVKPAEKMKGVIGTTNAEKSFEPLEKVILRSRNTVFVFKDGTIRFDATDVPLTHFRPSELGVSVEKMMELGYTADHRGNPLENGEQLCELMAQDVVLPDSAAVYFMKVAAFIDDLLGKFYGLPGFYNAKSREDLLGHLVLGLAPHTSAGVLGRVIGFTPARVGYAHPYFHCAKRRNCDGDEDSLMLLLDALLNFSKHYLPQHKGGKMDAPLILNALLNPKEVDDEVHAMEVVERYPLEFYEATLRGANPSEVRIETVADRLGKPNQYSMGFTHDTSRIDSGPLQSAYTTLATMDEKVKAELELGEKIRAVDERDMAERILNFHFLRDLYGNLKTFGQQKFRCVDCNASFRRVPLVGRCSKCGGKLLLTVSHGGIKKYLSLSKEIAEKYGLSDYLKQRLLLIEKDLDSIFHIPEEKTKQFSLGAFM